MWITENENGHHFDAALKASLFLSPIPFRLYYPQHTGWWRWLNRLGNSNNEKSVVHRLISADVHEHLSRAVVCFRKKLD